jgi:hypothetical protein
MKFAPSKLFHAVVISGAALTGFAGSQPAAAPAAAKKPPEASSPGTCPPGSERPFPPCYWIK